MKWHDLAELMRKKGTAIIYLYGKPYILMGITREDGGGKRFILTVRNENHPNQPFNHYVELID